MKVKSEVAQSCPTLCDPMDCSPPGSSTHGIFRARVLEWVATTFIPKTILGHLQYISPCNQINFQLIIIKHWEVNWELRGEEKNTGYKSKITNVNEFNSNFCIFEHSDEEVKWSCSIMSDSLLPHGLQPTRLLHPGDFPGKSTEVGCHCLFRVWIWELDYKESWAPKNWCFWTVVLEKTL